MPNPLADLVRQRQASQNPLAKILEEQKRQRESRQRGIIGPDGQPVPIPGALPGLNPPSPTPDYGALDANAKGAAAGFGSSLLGLPDLLGNILVGLDPGLRMAPGATALPGPAKRLQDRLDQIHQQGKDRLAAAAAEKGAPPLISAALDTAVEGAVNFAAPAKLSQAARAIADIPGANITRGLEEALNAGATEGSLLAPGSMADSITRTAARTAAKRQAAEAIAAAKRQAAEAIAAAAQLPSTTERAATGAARSLIQQRAEILDRGKLIDQAIAEQHQLRTNFAGRLASGRVSPQESAVLEGRIRGVDNKIAALSNEKLGLARTLQEEVNPRLTDEALTAATLREMGVRAAGPENMSVRGPVSGVSPDIAELARSSLAIGDASPPATSTVSRVVEDAGGGPVRSVRALDEAGNQVGEMKFQPVPGGYQTVNVETGQRGTGAMRAMMQEAQRISGGPRLGATTITTDEGQAALARLRETNPELFPAAGPDLNPAPKRGFIKRQFASSGPLTPEMHRVAVEAQGSINAELQQSAFLAQDLSREIKRLKVGSRSPLVPEGTTLQDVQGTLDWALRTADPAERASILSTLPEPNRARISDILGKMRGHIDSLSSQVADPEEALVSQKLRDVIEGNLGQYINRDFKAFTEPNYLNKVRDTAVWHEMAQKVSAENPDLSAPEVDGLLSYLADRDAKAFEMAAQGPGVGKVKRDIFKKRLTLDDTFLRFLGEIKDPVENYTNSVGKLANVIEHHRMLKAMGEEGLGKVFFERPIVANGVEYTTPIPGTETGGPRASLGAGQQLYTDKWTAKAITGSQKVRGLASLRFLNGVSKIGVTAFNPPVQVRNFVSNPLMVMANGHFFHMPGELKRVLGHSVEGARGVGVGPRLLKEAQRAKMEEWQRAGILGEGVNFGDLELYAGQIGDFFAGRTSQAGRAAAKGYATIEKYGIQPVKAAYRAGDDFWHVFAFEAEKDQYAKALPNASPEDIEKLASQIVRRQMPTYSEVGAALKTLRSDVPVIGPFVSFNAEVVRNVAHIARQGVTEIANPIPAVKAIGARRLAGLLGALSAPTLVSEALKARSHTSAKEEEAVRRFLYPWQQSSQIAILEHQGPKWAVVDLAFSDPYNYLKRPVIAAMVNRDNPEKAFWESLKEGVGPFAQEEIFAGKILDAMRNQTQDGYQVYEPAASKVDKALAISEHIGGALIPGFVTVAKRIKMAATGERTPSGRLYSKKDELLALTSGARITRFDVTERMQKNARQAADLFQSARRQFTGPARIVARGAGSPQDVRDATKRARESYDRIWGELQKDIQALRTLGVPDATIRQSLRGAGFSGIRSDKLLAGQKWDIASPL